MLPKDVREALLKERVKTAEDRRRLHDKNLNRQQYRATKADTAHLFFRIDIGPQFPQRPVCMNAFRNVLAIFCRPWERLKSTVLGKSYRAGPIVHGNVGTHHRHDSSNQRRCEKSIQKYLKELADTCADSYATRFVRERTSVGLRNDEITSVELPSNMTYRNIYCAWCYSEGYKPSADSKGNFGPVSDFPLRPHDDYVWPEGSSGYVCSWSSFQKVWKKFFPNMKIRNRCEDVCGECVRLRNSFQYIKRKKQEAQLMQQKNGDGDSVTSRVSASSDLTDDSNAELCVAGDTALVDNVEEQEYPEEYLWMRANDHAMKAQAQRQLVQQREREAKESRDLPHERRTYCLVADYCQNLSLPYFGSEQPGDTYYFSPLFVYVFGIADVSKDRPHLMGYGYHEGEGSKGGNNVASLLIQGLKDLGWLQDDSCGRRLTIAMDNCGGQNKNKMVLRLALYLVERKYFSTVEFIFYIRGHTKNVCDRLFNLLKIRYHKSDVYTMDMLVDVLNLQDDVTFQKTSSTTFKNYDKMLDTFYKNFKPGTIQKNHCFSVTCHSPTKMTYKSFINDNTEESFDFLKGEKDGREAAMATYMLEPLDTPGIREIKQVELWKNWRQFVPDPHKDMICPEPPQEVLDRIKKQKSDKQKEIAKKRKRGNNKRNTSK